MPPGERLRTRKPVRDKLCRGDGNQEYKVAKPWICGGSTLIDSKEREINSVRGMRARYVKTIPG